MSNLWVRIPIVILLVLTILTLTLSYVMLKFSHDPIQVKIQAMLKGNTRPFSIGRSPTVGYVSAKLL